LLAGRPELAEELLEVRDVVVVDVVGVVADAVAVRVGAQPVQGVDALDVDLGLGLVQAVVRHLVDAAALDALVAELGHLRDVEAVKTPKSR
jgi:hypothetical protein